MTRQVISIALDHTTVQSKCVLHRPSGNYVATLRFDSTTVELIGTLDAIDECLEQLSIDSACLRQQQEQDEARRSVA